MYFMQVQAWSSCKNRKASIDARLVQDCLVFCFTQAGTSLLGSEIA